jgi:DNA-binding transcriptional ArsR family regulator
VLQLEQCELADRGASPFDLARQNRLAPDDGRGQDFGIRKASTNTGKLADRTIGRRQNSDEFSVEDQFGRKGRGYEGQITTFGSNNMCPLPGANASRSMSIPRGAPTILSGVESITWDGGWALSIASGRAYRLKPPRLVATYYASVAFSSAASAGGPPVPPPGSPAPPGRPSPPEPPGRPPRTVIRDPEVMRALAHPARLAILEHLTANGGEITATEAAELVGLSPSATSYHLRALAKVNMIQDAPSRGDGRERVYTAGPPRQIDFSAEIDRDDPAGRAAEELLIDAVLDRAEARVRAWRARINDEPREWYDAAVINESVVTVTPDELRELVDGLIDKIRLFRRANRADVPEGARTVSIQLRAIPLA